MNKQAFLNLDPSLSTNEQVVKLAHSVEKIENIKSGLDSALSWRAFWFFLPNLLGFFKGWKASLDLADELHAQKSIHSVVKKEIAPVFEHHTLSGRHFAAVRDTVVGAYQSVRLQGTEMLSKAIDWSHFKDSLASLIPSFFSPTPKLPTSSSNNQSPTPHRPHSVSIISSKANIGALKFK